MLFRVTGAAGSGKTEYLYGKLEEACANGKKCVWISPEQQSVQTERELLDRLGDGCNLSVEVLNFERLPERIAREYGGLNVVYPDKGAICALLSLLCEDHRGELTEYKRSASDEAFVTGLYGLFGKLRSELIAPDKLFAAADKCGESERKLGRKLRDVALLYRAYTEWFTERTRDPRDALSVLASELPAKPFFAGKTVFVDGYYTFTGQEYALLDAVIKQADAVYCTFTYDERELFSGNRKAAERFQSAAGKTDIDCGEYKRSQKDELRFLEKHLWELGTPAFSGDSGAVKLISAHDPFGEANAVAGEILRLIRSGMRYRDITVLARDPSAYAGILDTVLRENRIPFFFAEKEGILNHPLIAFAIASLELIDSNLEPFALRKYLKTGYSGLDAEDGDLLLRYVEGWKLHGADWKKGKDWKKNPDGYREGALDEEQEAFLASVNRAKDRLLSDLEPLRTALADKEQTVDGMLAALYEHLGRVGAGERFLRKINARLRDGEEERARIDSQVWQMFSGVMERIHNLCGDRKLPVFRLLALLRLTAGAYSLGSIPTSSDAVSIGNPALFRGNSKAVIVIGCNDGVFPAIVGDDPLFDDDDAAFLEGEEINVVEQRLSAMNAERFYFYTAVAAPSEELILTWPTATVSGAELRPSPAITRVKDLLPHLTVTTPERDLSGRLSSYTGALEAFPLMPEGKEKEKLRAVLSEKGFDVPEMPLPIVDPSAQICYRGEELRLSASKLELYRKCPFRFFGESLMRLKEKKPIALSENEYGTFRHRVLELFLKEHFGGGKIVPVESEAALRAESDRIAGKCIDELLGEEKRDAKSEYELKKTVRTLLPVLNDAMREFGGGKFMPAGYEVGFGQKDGDLPAAEFTTEDGKKVFLRGVIDRVDTYEKDGELYARIIDYKSSDKGMDRELMETYGLDEQPLLYLFAYCGLLDAAGKPVHPAGAMYENVAPAMQKKNEKSKSRRTGLVLDGDGIREAMDPDGAGKFAPKSTTKSSMILPAEELGKLKTLLEQQLLQTADRIFSGDMPVKPLKLDSKHDACSFCKMRAACRRKGGNDDD